MRIYSSATHPSKKLGHSKTSSATRYKRMARYSSLYLPFKPVGYWREKACCYCGNMASTKDHIPPVVWLEALGPSYFDSRGLLVVWVPSCRECNVALGSNKLFSIRERTGYLIDYYIKKYGKLATVAKWTQEELDELRGRLKQATTIFAEHQLGIDRRLAILEENYSLRSLQDRLPA